MNRERQAWNQNHQNHNYYHANQHDNNKYKYNYNNNYDYDVIVVGGGPGGLAAAQGAREAGAARVLVLERENRSGGILNQCIHDGFGLVRYRAMLTGPEYAARARAEATAAGAEVRTGATVTGLTANRTVTAVTRQGLLRLRAGAVVLATGCRERTRGAVAIPGSRPAGIFTAGTAQNLINTKHIMVGKRVVILGSGDIGLIMARRLTLEGAQVLCVAEREAVPGGLERNVSQCLYDFDIPLYLRCTVTKIMGQTRVEGVELSRLDERGQPISDSQWTVGCDTLLLSVGLIPENEVAQLAGVALRPDTNGAVTDAFLQTSVPGIFSCGNSRKVLDLADFVTEQGLTAGRNAAAFVQNRPMEPMPPETANAMAKGLPQPGVITCILCPKGCRVQKTGTGAWTGSGCPKGAAYAQQETVAPKRVLTTTLSGRDGRPIPVKTAAGIPKAQLLTCMKHLPTLPLDAPKSLGNVAATDPFGLGVDLLVSGEE